VAVTELMSALEYRLSKPPSSFDDKTRTLLQHSPSAKFGTRSRLGTRPSQRCSLQLKATPSFRSSPQHMTWKRTSQTSS
jgi:hypothetical protein